MTESTIPVNLMNPGQVFACVGIVEVADMLLGDAAGVFDWKDDRETKFHVTADGCEGPVERVLRFLEEAEVKVRVPEGSGNLESWKESWKRKLGELTVVSSGYPFPFPDPSSPAMLPVTLTDKNGNEITVEYWGDATKRDNVKFWAGSSGYPGAVLLHDAVQLIKGKTQQHSGDPFAIRETQSSSFRFDWRRDYIPVDVGFSPNEHKGISMAGFPVVELLAAIGVSHARPKRLDKLKYNYGVLGGADPLNPIFLRAALGADISPIPGAPYRRFTMYLDWPGQKNQARCITHVKEEVSDDKQVD